MTDEELIRHLERDHPGSMISGHTGEPVMEWPEGEPIKLRGRPPWDAYHIRLHGGEVPEGPSILDLVWAELDRKMELMMIGAGSQDDVAEARGLAVALSIFVNPYSPDLDAIRTEAVTRWKERADAQPLAEA